MENIEKINEKVNIEKVLSFIEENFNASSKADSIKDFSKLVKYLEDEDISLTLEDADLLIKKSNKLVSVIECIQSENVDNTEIESIENLFLAFDLSKDPKDDTYLVDSLVVPQLGKSLSLDTMKLYLTSMPRLLTVEEEKKLIDRISKGDEEAKKILVEHNLRLAVSIAKRFTNSGVALNDLIQEGNIGLMIAANKFDKKSNCRFSTYATWWIKQRITRYIADNSRTVRVPVYMHEQIIKLEKTKKRLAVKLNRDVTRKDLADELGMTEDEILKIEKYGADCVSLDTKVNAKEDSDASELGSFVADENAYFEGKVIDNLYFEQLNNIIFNGDAIDEKSKLILQYRFGFIDGKPKTLEEVGKVFGVTRERIRQIEAKSLRILRNSATLRDYRPNRKEIDENTYQNNSYNLVLNRK